MIRTVALMGTIVTIHVVDDRPDDRCETQKTVERALGWFDRVEACCTRFDARSEVMQLTSTIGVPVRASEILYEAVQFALAVAEESGGAFDPTVGYSMETRGFNREYRTGRIVRTALEPGGGVSYRDVRVNPDRKTITLLRPLVLDLGAVAKGLAIDMAARELQRFEHYAIDAGGDLYLAGRGPDREPWSVGIRHPRHDHQLIDALRVSNMAVCTSGDYERRSAGEADGHHILDPRTSASANAVASVTVVAPTAMSADALATAAFVLGPTDGIQLLERQGVNGLMVSPTLERYATQGLSASGPTVLSNAERPSHHRLRRSDRHGRNRPGHPAGGAWSG
jgi:thiamine biosynthesis lipoprotein